VCILVDRFESWQFTASLGLGGRVEVVNPALFQIRTKLRIDRWVMTRRRRTLRHHQAILWVFVSHPVSLPHKTHWLAN
jgi:hypothetical protein